MVNCGTVARQERSADVIKSQARHARVMKGGIFALAGIALCGCANSPVRDSKVVIVRMEVDVANGACMARDLATRLELRKCLSDSTIAAYARYDFPWMDAIYQFEAEALKAAGQADTRIITQSQYDTAVEVAKLQMKAKLQQRFREASEAQKQAAIAVFLHNGYPVAQLPLHAIPTRPWMNCTASFISDFANTNC